MEAFGVGGKVLFIAAVERDGLCSGDRVTIGAAGGRLGLRGGGAGAVRSLRTRNGEGGGAGLGTDE